jgi:hypothetical protein
MDRGTQGLRQLARRLQHRRICRRQKRSFQPYTDDTILPTSDKQEVWASFALPVTENLQTWYIRLPGQAFFKVSLYARDAQGNWQVQSAGEAIAPAYWALRTRVPSFELQSHADQPQTYYLRFEHRRPITERPMLLTPIEYIDGASRVGVVIGLMWGMFSVLAVLCLAAFSMARNKVFLWFGAVVVTLMFTQLVLIGYGGWRIWPYSVHLNQVMGWVSSTVTMAAGRLVLRPGQLMRATATRASTGCWPPSRRAACSWPA